jgi:hypothetical protein
MPPRYPQAQSRRRARRYADASLGNDTVTLLLFVALFVVMVMSAAIVLGYPLPHLPAQLPASLSELRSLAH